MQHGVEESAACSLRAHPNYATPPERGKQRENLGHEGPQHLELVADRHQDHHPDPKVREVLLLRRPSKQRAIRDSGPASLGHRENFVPAKLSP